MKRKISHFLLLSVYVCFQSLAKRMEMLFFKQIFNFWFQKGKSYFPWIWCSLDEISLLEVLFQRSWQSNSKYEFNITLFHGNLSDDLATAAGVCSDQFFLSQQSSENNDRPVIKPYLILLIYEIFFLNRFAGEPGALFQGSSASNKYLLYIMCESPCYTLCVAIYQ